MRLSKLFLALSSVFLIGIAPAFADDDANYEYPVTPPATPFRVVTDDHRETMRVYGEVMPFVGGKVETWLSFTAKGLYKVGLTLSPETLLLQNLPATGHHGAHIQFPRVPGSPFEHAYFIFHSHGHPPEDIYNLAHFDFHLALIPSDDIQAIRFEDPKGQILPPPGFMPSKAVAQRLPGGGYLNVPGEGVHWYYKDAPEWNGGPFSETFLWGSFNGKVDFLEPMVSYQAMISTAKFEKKIELPKCVAKSAFYPSVYGWEQKYDQAGKMYIESYMKDFVFKAATKPASACR